VVKARRKLLKTDGLLVFQFDAKMPSFSAGNGLAEKGNSLGQPEHGAEPGFRHGDCTTSI
jgi:hypothetical protein